MGIPIKQIEPQLISDFVPVKKKKKTESAPELPKPTKLKPQPEKIQIKPKKPILALIAAFFYFVFLLSALTVCGTIIWLSILPLKYLSVVIAFIIILAAILGYFTFKRPSTKKTKKKSKKHTKAKSTKGKASVKTKTGHLTKIICIFFDLLFTAILGIIYVYLNHTIGFMDSIQASEYQIDNYYILVKKTSRFTTLEELNGHSVAVYDDGSENYEKAFGMLKEKVSLTATDWGSVTNAVNATINGSSDSLFIKSSLTESLSEFMDNFSIDNFNILDTIEIKTEITTTADSNINISEDSFNIFISGIDTYGTISTVARSDVNMIVTVNPRTHTVLLTSIPRDFYVQLHGTTGLKDKLTHAGLYGINMSINTIQDLFGIKIDYYIRVNFDSTIKLIDALGGIDITPDFTFSRKTNGIYCSYEKGRVNHLDGFCALRYARERKAYGAGDLHRIQNQQEVLVAIIDKLTSSKVLLARYTDILSSLSGTLETNIPSSQIYKLVNNQLDTMPSWKIERIATTGTHIDAPTYTFGSQLLYVFVPDMESVAKAAKKIEAVMSAN